MLYATKTQRTNCFNLLRSMQNGENNAATIKYFNCFSSDFYLTEKQKVEQAPQEKSENGFVLKPSSK